MKFARNSSASNLAPPRPEGLALMREIATELQPPEGAALNWTEDGGFQFYCPAPPEGQSIPMPAYILGLCFVRLTADPYFKQEMMNWASRNTN